MTEIINTGKLAEKMVTIQLMEKELKPVFDEILYVFSKYELSYDQAEDVIDDFKWYLRKKANFKESVS